MDKAIRVYTPYLDLKDENDRYSSAQLERNYHDVGEFELHVNQYLGADHIKKGDIITLGDSTHKAGIIRSVEIGLTDEGKQSEEWTYEGVTLQGLINQRITVPPEGKSYDRKSGPAETVMKHYIKRNFVEPDDSKRKMKELVIAPDKERGKKVEHESRYKNVSDELADISKESGLGWIVYIDYSRHKFVFDVVEGLDPTQDNEDGNDPVFFSPDFGTISSQDFSDSDSEFANYSYVAGQGEGKDRKIVEIGESTGINRFEMFVDARDVSDEYDEDDDEYVEDADQDSDDNKRPDEEIEEDLKKRGKEKMDDKKNELSLEAEILSPTTRDAYTWTHDGYKQPIQPYGHYERKEQAITPFTYEKDFDLGDTVPVYNRSWGVTMTSRITKIKEIHEPGGFRLEATFGEERPTLVSKIKKEFDEINGVEKQEIPAQLIKKESKYRDDKLSQEQQDRIEQAKENLQEAKDYTYDKDTIDDKDKKIADDAKKDAKEKAEEARKAAEEVAEAKAELAETEAKAHADGKVTDEEKRAIKDAKEKLEEAKDDAKDKSDAAEKSAKEYAELKSKEAQEAAEEVAKAKAELAETEAKAHADDKVTKEEEARIDQAKADLKEAKAAADLAEKQAKAYADGELTKEEKRAIDDAKDKLKEAKKHAEEADKKVEENAKKHADEGDEKTEKNAKDHTEEYSEKKVHVGESPPDDTDKKWLDTSGNHDRWRRYNHDSSADDDKDKWETDDVIDKDTTFADEWLLARHIESLNGLTVGGGQFEVDDDGNVYFAGTIKGADGEFTGTVKGGKIETFYKSGTHEDQKSKLEMEGGLIKGFISEDDIDEDEEDDTSDPEQTSENNDEQSDDEGDEDDSGRGDDDDGGDDDGDEDEGDGDSSIHDTEVRMSPNLLGYYSKDKQATMTPHQIKISDYDINNHLYLKNNIMYFSNKTGHSGIRKFGGEDRDAMVIRGNYKKQKYGANLYVYGNNDPKLPGAFRLMDGSSRGELLRGYKGNLFTYAPIKAKSKYLMESTKDKGLIHMPNKGKIVFARANGFPIMEVRGDSGDSHRGSIKLPDLANYTTTKSANVYVSSGQNILRAESSKRVKKDIKDIELDLAENVIDNVDAVQFTSTASGDNGEKMYGFIAEDVAEVDEKLVDFNDEGDPVNVEYDRIPAHHHRILQDHKQRIKNLEDENAELKGMIKDLTTRLEKLENA